MATKDQKVPSLSIQKIKSQLKNPDHIKVHNSLRANEQKALPKTVAKYKIHPSSTNKVQQLSLLPLIKEVPDVLDKKIMPIRVRPTLKNRKLLKKNIPKTKPELQAENQTPDPQSPLTMKMPKLGKIIDDMTRLVKIDHDKVYPLLGIFIDYVQESLPGRVNRNSLTSEDLDSQSEEFQEKVKRFEKQRMMDPLISPGVDSDNINNKDYDDNVMQSKLAGLLPILRKCNGNVNFTDKNGQTILHIFIKRYVVVHKILHEADLSKAEYKNSPQTYLRKATFHVIEALLKIGASVNIADVQGNTPLHTIAKYDGYEEIMKVLLEHFTEVDNCDKNGDTVLHLMVGSQETNEKTLENIGILVLKGADMHKINNNEKAPIHIALESCQFEKLVIFEKEGADFNLRTKGNQTSLHIVCKFSTRDDVKKMNTIDLLMSKGVDVNAIDNEGYSALHYAVKFSSKAIIQQLISLGANVTCQIKKMNLTPLHLASQFNCPGAINTLIEAGVNVNSIATGGIIPLHLALLHSDPLTVECLILNGADLYRRDAIFGFTPTHMTAFACRKKLDLLVKKGADVNVKNRMGMTPLHLASIVGNVKVVESLCDHGSDTNCRDNVFGMTPLHWASMKGKRLNLNRIVNGSESSEDEIAINEFWKPLFLKTCQHCENHDNIDSNASSNVCTMFKANPSACIIVLQPYSEVMKVLLKFGTQPDMQDDEGRVAVYNVVKSDNVEGMKHLVEHGLDLNDSEVIHWILNTWNSVKVRSYVLWNAMKFRIAELPIAEAYLPKIVKSQFQCYYSYWQEEVQKLKKYLIDDKVSLHDMLRMKSKRRFGYVQRVMLLRRDLEINLPDYHSLILASCRQAVVRMDLEELAKLAFIRVNNVRWSDPCYERVFSYLNNVDLRAFVEGVENI